MVDSFKHPIVAVRLRKGRPLCFGGTTYPLIRLEGDARLQLQVQEASNWSLVSLGARPRARLHSVTGFKTL